MNRRDFIALAGTAAAFPRVALAEQATKVPRIAYLSLPEVPQRPDAFRKGMADQGYVDGKNLTIEFYVPATNNAADLPALAAKAVASNPDVIFTEATAPTQAAKDATTTIPIVFANVGDPTGAGLIADLAHPGGNITGTSNYSAYVLGKEVSIAKELVPPLTRLAIVNVPAEAVSLLYRDPLLTAAKVLGVEPVFIDFVDGPDIAQQAERLIATGAQAVLSPRYAFTNGNSRDVLFDFFLKNGVVAVSSDVVDGAMTPFFGVVSYGANALTVIVRAASFVSAILKGAKPGDLPVEVPTAYDFAVNLDTARKIGLTIPPSILAQATLVVDEDWRAPKAAK